MNRGKQLHLYSLLAGTMALLVSSCGDGGGGKASQSKQLTERYPEWSPSGQTDEQVWRKDRTPILHGIVRKQYGNLDEFTDRLADRYRCGRSVRFVFYDAFGNYHRRNTDSEALRWHPVYEEGFKEWATLKPDSPCPTIGLACLYSDRAWLYRGDGWADDVTEEGWKGFRENLDLAHETLNNAPAFVRKDPHYYRALIVVGLGKGLPIDTVNGFFRAGQDLDPLYFPLYNAMTSFLQPRWYGTDPKEWTLWLQNALKHKDLTEEDRLVIYARAVHTRIVHLYANVRDPAEVFEVMGVDKSKFMKGLAAYVRRYPDSSEWPLHYLYHAYHAGDVAAIKDAIELSDKQFDSKDWKRDELVAFFEEVVSDFPEMAEPLGRKE